MKSFSCADGKGIKKEIKEVILMDEKQSKIISSFKHLIALFFNNMIGIHS